MPTDQPTAASSGVPLQIGDRSFVAMPLTDRQWGEMTRWLQSRMFRIYKGSIDPELSDIEQEREEQHALSLVSRLDARVSMKDIAVVPEGFAFWTWQMVRRAHDKITLEEVTKLLEDSNETDNVYTAWKLLMHVEGEPKKPEAETKA